MVASKGSSDATTVVNPTVTVAAPPAFVAATAITITTTTTPAGLGLEASLDGAAYAAIDAAWQLTGLGEGEHTARIRARGAPASEQVVTWYVDTTPPSAPTDLVVTADRAGELALSWTPGGDAGSGLADYVIAYGTAAGSASGNALQAAPANAHRLAGLAACQTYFVTLTCRDRAGNTSSATGEVACRANCGGDGTFTASRVPLTNAAATVASGDFNGDRILDVAAGDDEVLQILLGGGGNGRGDGSFVAGQGYAAGSTIVAIEVADFDADRISDIALLNETQLRIYRGEGSDGVGNGQFLLSATITAGLSTPQALFAGDVDADQIVDLVVGDWGGNALIVFRGNGSGGRGNGTFSSASAVATGQAPGAIASGDFNADGITDLAVACQSGTEVLVTHLGLGSNGRNNGSFAPMQTWLSGGFVAGDVLVTDMNGDRIDDLVVTLALANAVCFMAGSGSGGRGNGSFYLDEVVGVGTRPWGLVAGDFTGDNLTDYMSLSYLQAGATLVRANGSRGRGNGTFTTSTAGGTGISLFRGIAGDVDGNGSLDLVAGDLGGALVVLRNHGRRGVADGSFAGRGGDPYAIGSAFGLGIADLDSDRVPDVLLASYQTPSGGGNDFLTTLLNIESAGLGTGVLPSGTLNVVGSGPTAVASGDFDRDGIVDVACLASDLELRGGGQRVDVLPGMGSNGVGSGTLGSSTSVAVGQAARAIVAGDWNRDAILDLAVANQGDDTVTILLGNGSGGRGNGTFTASTPIGTAAGPFALVTGDWNADGIADLAIGRVTGTLSGGVQVLLGQGSNGVGNGTFAAGSSLATTYATTGLAVGDFDGNGIQDLAATQWRGGGATPSSGVVLFAGNGSAGRGDGTFTAGSEIAIGGNARAIAAGDFDHDGVLDLAVTDGDTPTLRILRGNGSGGRGNGTFATPTGFGLETAAEALVAVDLDSDGVLDLIAAGADRVSLRFGGGRY